jgi:hypothetical protein
MTMGGALGDLGDNKPAGVKPVYHELPIYCTMDSIGQSSGQGSGGSSAQGGGANAQNTPASNTQNAPAVNAQNIPPLNPQNIPAGNAENIPAGNAENIPAGNAENIPAGNAENIPPLTFTDRTFLIKEAEYHIAKYNKLNDTHSRLQDVEPDVRIRNASVGTEAQEALVKEMEKTQKKLRDLEKRVPDVHNLEGNPNNY